MSDFSGLSNICQVGMVVRDLDASIRKFESLGIGPWQRFGFDASEVPGTLYRGKPADFKLKVAMTRLGSWELELLQPVEGDSIYDEFLEEHGEALHHLGAFFDNAEDYWAAYNEFIKRGMEPIMGGPIPGDVRDGRFDYFDTAEEYGTILELVDNGEGRVG